MTKKKYKKLKRELALARQENRKLRIDNIFLRVSDVWTPSLSAMNEYRNLNLAKPVNKFYT